jgi:hypothetical protein
MKGDRGLFYNGLEWLSGLLFSLILVHHCSLSLPYSNPQLLVATNFGEVVYMQFYSKSGVPCNIESVFLVAIQWYMACLIW